MPVPVKCIVFRMLRFNESSSKSYVRLFARFFIQSAFVCDLGFQATHSGFILFANGDSCLLQNIMH